MLRIGLWVSVRCSNASTRSAYCSRSFDSCCWRASDQSSPKLPQVVDPVPWMKSSHGFPSASAVVGVVSSNLPVSSRPRKSPSPGRLPSSVFLPSTRRAIASADLPARSMPMTLSDLTTQEAAPRVSRDTSPGATSGSSNGTSTTA